MEPDDRLSWTSQHRGHTCHRTFWSRGWPLEELASDFWTLPRVRHQPGLLTQDRLGHWVQSRHTSYCTVLKAGMFRGFPAQRTEIRYGMTSAILLWSLLNVIRWEIIIILPFALDYIDWLILQDVNESQSNVASIYETLVWYYGASFDVLIFLIPWLSIE